MKEPLDLNNMASFDYHPLINLKTKQKTMNSDF